MRIRQILSILAIGFLIFCFLGPAFKIEAQLGKTKVNKVTFAQYRDWTEKQLAEYNRQIADLTQERDQLIKDKQNLKEKLKEQTDTLDEFKDVIEAVKRIRSPP